MTIQRQYTLPSCNLVLEGLSTDDGDFSAPMAVLMNAECHLPGAAEKPLSGGREFLEGLVAAVSGYAQQLLSGIAHPLNTEEQPLIQLKPGEGPYHHLIMRAQAEAAHDSKLEAVSPQDIRLSTVQFFDLLDAVDQFLSDNQTLPDLVLPLRSVSRRYVRPEEPVAKRVAPAMIGASTLAAAAITLFFVPPPQFEPVREESSPAAEATSETTTNASQPAASDPPSAPDASDPATSALATPDSTTPAPATVENPAPEGAITDLERLADAPALSAAEQTAVLETFQQQLQQAWQAVPPPPEAVSYRIAVSGQGDILGYKYEGDAALAYAENTPLPGLAYLPVDQTESVQEPVAQLRATFTPEGRVQVETWTASPTDAAQVGGVSLDPIVEPIDSSSLLGDLNENLRQTLAESWNNRDIDADLAFRVRLSQQGDIIGYKAVDSEPIDPSVSLPLAALVIRGGSQTNFGAQADFKVVFAEEGVVEVSPWDGWPD